MTTDELDTMGKRTTQLDLKMHWDGPFGAMVVSIAVQTRKGQVVSFLSRFVPSTYERVKVEAIDHCVDQLAHQFPAKQVRGLMPDLVRQCFAEVSRLMVEGADAWPQGKK